MNNIDEIALLTFHPVEVAYHALVWNLEFSQFPSLPMVLQVPEVEILSYP